MKLVLFNPASLGEFVTTATVKEEKLSRTLPHPFSVADTPNTQQPFPIAFISHQKGAAEGLGTAVQSSMLLKHAQGHGFYSQHKYNKHLLKYL